MLSCYVRARRISPRLLERFRGAERATAAIEFAIIAPIFILLVMGMIAYGIYFGASHSIAQISADAARVALAGLDEAERQALVADFIERNADDYAFVDKNEIEVEAHDNDDDATQFIVAVSYRAEDLPIWNLLSGLPLPRTTIFRQSTIRVGGI